MAKMLGMGAGIVALFCQPFVVVALSSTMSLTREGSTISTTTWFDSSGFGLIFYDRNSLGKGTVKELSTTTVFSHRELSSYAEKLLVEDPHIESISADSSSVSMRYDARAKMLGFVPMIVSVRAEVNSEGKVSISYPWYGGLLQKDDTPLVQNLSQSIAEALIIQPGIPNTGGTSNRMSASTQALILKKMQAVLKEDFDATSASSAKALARN